MSDWKCIKCGNSEFEKDQFQATGGNFAKYLMFKIKNLLLLAVLNVVIQRFIKQQQIIQ